MRIARIAGTVTATIKNKGLAGIALLLANTEGADGTVFDKSIVVADTLGAGPGDLVLLTTGSAARIQGGLAGSPVDAATIAIIDRIQTSVGQDHV